MPFPFKGVLYEMFTQQHAQGIHPHGRRLPCADFEINHAECMEAYGIVKGQEVCEKFHEDLMECFYGRLRTMRYTIMRLERFKKIAKGEIPMDKRWGQPYPHDSFVAGTFFP